MPRLLTTVTAILLVFSLLVACSAPAAEVPAPPVAVAAIAAEGQLDVAQVEPTATAPAPTATAGNVLVGRATAVPTVPPENHGGEEDAPAADPATTATVRPTPQPRPAGTPWRVGLQIGHLRSNELPDELARLRTSTGAQWNGITEAQLNEDIALRVKPLLEAQGIVVDLIPATVPPDYDADAFIAIHADGNRGTAPRGWKLANYWRASPASRQLLAAIAGTYGVATGLPEDVGGVTNNMRGYYAFNYRRYEHSIADTTPAVIVEMGFMTNARDREVLFNRPDSVAKGIADGIIAYFAQRDPNDGAALLPPDFPPLQAREPGVVVRVAPRDNARVMRTINPEDRIFVFSQANGWYEIFVRGSSNQVGFVREEFLVRAPDPTPTPQPANP